MPWAVMQTCNLWVLSSNAAPFTHCLVTLDKACPLPFWSLIWPLGMIAVRLFLRMKWKTEIKHLLPILTAYFRAGITLGAIEGRRLSFALKVTPLLGHFHPRFCDKYSNKESPWCSHKTVRKCKADLSDSPRCCVCLFLVHVRDLAFVINVFLNPWADEGILWVPVWSVWAKSENLPWKY